MKETNMEHYRGEIEEVLESSDELPCLIDGKLQECKGNMDCHKCEFSGRGDCGLSFVKWAMSEYKEDPVLTAREQGFVEGVEGGCIVRDKNGDLTWYAKLPIRDNLNGLWYMSRGSSSVDLNEYYFPFITWEDEEPWSVEELRKLKVADEG